MRQEAGERLVLVMQETEKIIVQLTVGCKREGELEQESSNGKSARRDTSKILLRLSEQGRALGQPWKVWDVLGWVRQPEVWELSWRRFAGTYGVRVGEKPSGNVSPREQRLVQDQEYETWACRFLLFFCRASRWSAVPVLALLTLVCAAGNALRGC